MPLAIPPELKKIAPFVKRAEELDRDQTSAESRLVAYYCRQFAVHQGIPLASTSAGAKTCLGHLLEVLEKEKPAMDNFTRDEAAFWCRKFAMNVFDKADLEDREGAANKNTAKTFYAAASFLQILEQFEEEGSEQMAADKKKIIYAKWKATDILKALKEGRTPTPGGIGEEEEGQEAELKEDKQQDKEDAPPMVETVTGDDSNNDADKDDAFHMPAAPPVAPMAPPKPASPPPTPPPESNEEEAEEDDEGQEVELGPPPAYPGPAATHQLPAPSNASPVDRPALSFDLPPPVSAPPLPAPVAPVPAVQKKSGGIFGFGKKKGATKAQIGDATELTRFALAALEDKDADLAAERLKQALQSLGR